MKALLTIIFCIVVSLSYVNGRPGQHRRAFIGVVRAFNELCGNTTGIDPDSCIAELETEDKTAWDDCLTAGNFTDNSGLLTAICQNRSNFRKMRRCILTAATTNWESERGRITSEIISLRGRERRTKRRQMRNDYFSAKITAANNAQKCVTALGA
ncbi:uncharacterized protein LOC106472181 [Limulus polyphemus]|uniref:Uncharacterized protein LOC106472181 n=1 Tax=Limulus polyphemus TaxID=6850 RepID=A0ABM1BTI3_LIMPO|nr:uncharacterized protein LOC106472181 [Limulus polyphemus]